MRILECALTQNPETRIYSCLHRLSIESGCLNVDCRGLREHSFKQTKASELQVTSCGSLLVEKVANESQKTPRDVVMMENFHHIFSTLSRLKISCLDAEKREAKHKYTDHLQSYVINSLGQPLEKLNV